MKKPGITLIFTIAFIVFAIGQTPQKNTFNAHAKAATVPKNNSFYPDLKFIDNHKNLFIEFSQQINTIKKQFKDSKQNYTLAQKYKKSYDSLMAIVHQGQGYLSKRKIRKIRRKAVNDSLNYAKYMTYSLNFCRQGYKNLNDKILKNKQAQLVSVELPKKQNQPNFKFRIAVIDTITRKLIKLNHNITLLQAKDKTLKGKQKLDNAKQICFKQKQVTNFYYDLITSVITNNPAELTIIANKYKVKQSVAPQIALYKKYLIPADLTGLQNITNLTGEIKQLENELNQPNLSQFLKNNLYTSLAEKYYTLYNTLLDYYITNDNTLIDSQTIVQAKQLRQHADNILSYFNANSPATSGQFTSTDKYWLAATLLADAVVLCQRSLGYFDNSKLDKNFANLNLISTPSYVLQYSTNTQNLTTQKTQKQKITNPTKPQIQPKRKRVTLCSTLYQYTINQAKPTAVYERGTFYRIDLGNQPADLVPTAWKNYLPLSFFKFCNSHLKHFYAGRYKTFAAANQAANEIYHKWHINTKIVKFSNGKPVATYHRQKLTKKQPAVNKKATYDNSSKYGVQIGLYSKKLSSSQLAKTYKNILNYNIHYLVSNGKYVYYIPAKDLNTAKQIKTQIRNLGVKGAFVILITKNGPVPANKH